MIIIVDVMNCGLWDFVGWKLIIHYNNYTSETKKTQGI